MSFNLHFLEKNQAVVDFVPVAMNTNPGPVGDWVSLKDYGRCAIVFVKAIGTAGDDPTITILQATKVDGTGSKAGPTITRVDKKQGTQTTLGQFTTSTPTSPALHDTFSVNTWTNSDLAENQAIVVIDVKAEDLDIDNGFCCLQANIGDVGTNAQLGTLLYVLHEPKYAAVPLPSAIVD